MSLLKSARRSNLLPEVSHDAEKHRGRRNPESFFPAIETSDFDRSLKIGEADCSNATSMTTPDGCALALDARKYDHVIAIFTLYLIPHRHPERVRVSFVGVGSA